MDQKITAIESGFHFLESVGGGKEKKTYKIDSALDFDADKLHTYDKLVFVPCNSRRIKGKFDLGIKYRIIFKS